MVKGRKGEERSRRKGGIPPFIFLHRILDLPLSPNDQYLCYLPVPKGHAWCRLSAPHIFLLHVTFSCRCMPAGAGVRPPVLGFIHSRDGWRWCAGSAAATGAYMSHAMATATPAAKHRPLSSPSFPSPPRLTRVPCPHNWPSSGRQYCAGARPLTSLSPSSSPSPPSPLLPYCFLWRHRDVTVPAEGGMRRWHRYHI